MWYTVRRKLPIDSLLYNFLPSWWHRGYGLDFGREFVFGPDYRVSCHQEMARTLARRFPQLAIGDSDPVADVVPPDFGNAATAAAAGCEIAYPVDNYPWNRHLEAEKVRALEVPSDITSVFPYSEIVSQVERLNSRLGRTESPLFVPRGVLNDAVLIRGQDFFLDREEDPELAGHLLAFCYGILQAVVNFNAANRRPETTILTNCTVPFVGPESYTDWLLPFDLEIFAVAEAAGCPFGIHHCGVFDPYLSAYRRIPKVEFLEIGWGSDIAKTLAGFPEALVRYIYSAQFLLSASAVEVEEETERILARVPAGDRHRFSLSVPDIEHGTRDENLLVILEACLRQDGLTVPSL